MGREVKRVPLDFTWPVRQVWWGYILPDSLRESKCLYCEGGYSPYAQLLHDRWYGNAPFKPEDNGQVTLKADSPVVLRFAERNVQQSPEFYGTDGGAVYREASRLAKLWNGMWSHHLNQDDVDALVTAGRLNDLTHTWSPSAGWQPKEPPVRPAATQVNEWSVNGIGHDSINASVVIRARCEREGIAVSCEHCNGNGSVERHPGQREAAENWDCTEPPAGNGWQLWETVTEGSPVSGVFSSAEGLAAWMSRDDHPGTISPITYENALAFVHAGWAPSGVISVVGLQEGASYVGAREAESGKSAAGADGGDKA